MKKNSSYRDKLLELAKIYKIIEVNSYIKNKKYLTTPQIELILKKNNVPIPTELNKSIIEIHSKKITKPFSSATNAISDFFYSIINILFVKSFKKLNLIALYLTTKTYKFFRFIFLGFINSIYSFFNGVLNLCSFISKGTVNLLNSVYNIQVEKKTANKFVLGSVFFAFLTIGVLGGIKVADYIKDKEITKIQSFVEKIFGETGEKKKADIKGKELAKADIDIKKPEKKTYT